jgi:FAD/FMN-containing dehydrogenase
MPKLNEISLARVPFAVKGSGHITNPGFSSTPGVHISMSRFKDIVIHEDSETVEIGAGLAWSEVYEYLIPKGINVVGGRIEGVGVAGLTLGGGKSNSFLQPGTISDYTRLVGYSWKTNQYGLTVDTVTQFELVLPNGEIETVTEKDEDLWFALKVGGSTVVTAVERHSYFHFVLKGGLNNYVSIDGPLYT